MKWGQLFLAIMLMAGNGALSCSRANHVESGERRVVGEFVSRIEKQDFSGAAKLFHYPESYKTGDRELDIHNVSGGLALLVVGFGTPSQLEFSQDSWSSLDLGIGGGTYEYWQSKDNFGRNGELTFKTRFAKLGPGYLHFYFYRSTSAPELQSVAFSLPSSRAGASADLAPIARRLGERLIGWSSDNRPQEQQND